MKVHDASRRAMDCYVALLEGFYVVDTPYGPVLCPEGLAGDSWEWRPDVTFTAFIPSFTRDPATGVAALARHGFTLKSTEPDALEHCVAAMLKSHFGEELPPIRGMPAHLKRKNRRSKRGKRS